MIEIIKKETIINFLESRVKNKFIESYSINGRYDFSGMDYKIYADFNRDNEEYLYITDAISSNFGDSGENVVYITQIPVKIDNNTEYEYEEEYKDDAENDWYDYKQDQLLEIIQTNLEPIYNNLFSDMISNKIEEIVENEEFQVLGKDFTFNKDGEQEDLLNKWREDLSDDLTKLNLNLLENLDIEDLEEFESANEKWGTTEFVTISLGGHIHNQEVSVMNKRIIEITEHYFTESISVGSSIY